jgi:hypothetical protein
MRFAFPPYGLLAQEVGGLPAELDKKFFKWVGEEEAII